MSNRDGRGQRWKCYFSHNINVSLSVLLADFTANCKTTTHKKGEIDRTRNEKVRYISASKTVGKVDRWVCKQQDMCQ